MSLLLNDEEMKEIVVGEYNRCKYGVQNEEPCYTMDNVNTWHYSRFDIALSSRIAKAQLKNVYVWGNEPCPHNGLMDKRSCSKCWQALLEEVK